MSSNVNEYMLNTARDLLGEALDWVDGPPAKSYDERPAELRDRIEDLLSYMERHHPQPTPVVVVVRDPDSDNDYTVFDGPAETYDIDLGRADLRDDYEFLCWAASHGYSAMRYHLLGRVDVATYIKSVIEDQMPRHDEIGWPEIDDMIVAEYDMDALTKLASS